MPRNTRRIAEVHQETRSVECDRISIQGIFIIATLFPAWDVIGNMELDFHLGRQNSPAVMDVADALEDTSSFAP